MIFKGKNKYFIILSVLFLLIYFFVVAKKTDQGAYFTPEWVCSLSDTNIDEVYSHEEYKKTYPFRLGQYFGYFSDTGTIIQQNTTENRFSISKDFWTTYAEKAHKTPIYSAGNNKNSILTINAAGFIHLDDDRIFLFHPDGYSLSQFDKTGNKIWSYSHCAPITAFNSSPNGAVIGYSDGKLVYVNNEGKVKFEFYPGGSTHQVIMGGAISEDGEQVLCVCGLQNQRVILIKVKDSHHKIVHHSSFKKDLKRQVFVDFDLTGKFAIFESGDGIGIIDCESYETKIIKENGIVIGIGKNIKNSVLTILMQNDDKNTLLAIYPPSLVIGKTQFKAKKSFLIQDEDSVYLGSNNKIIKLKIKGLQK